MLSKLTLEVYLGYNMSSQFVDLPTGKPHVSFSEVKLWKECSWRHHLVHVKKIDVFKPSPILDFGTSAHSACEDYLKTREMKPEIALGALEKAWEKNKEFPEYSPAALEKAKVDMLSVLKEVPAFMAVSFPDWEFIAAEEQLYEMIDGHQQAFKGFIDGVVKSKGKRGEDLVWLIDWKTSASGWRKNKRQDPMTAAQLVLYKSFWSQKHNIDLKSIRCAFVLLKKSAKLNHHCELVPVSVGDVVIKRNLKIVSSMLTSVKRGVALKNRDSCTYCEYKGTEHCS